MVRPTERENMPNRAVSIYERVNGNKKPTWRPVEIPARQKPLGGGLYLKDNRNGEFYISWYEGKRKRFKKVKGDLLLASYAGLLG